MKHGFASTALLAAAAGCHSAPTAAPVALTQVTAMDTKPVIGVVELDGTLCIFDRAGVTVMRSGALVARDDFGSATPSPPSTIAAPDGEGRWVVSALHRVTPAGEVQAIDEERLGLTPNAGWSTLFGAADTAVAISPQTVAVAADGHHVSLYPLPGANAGAVAVANGRVALAGATGVQIWDLAAGTSRTYPLANARVAFLDADQPGARLAAWTDRELAVEQSPGTGLHRIATTAPITSVAASGHRLWVDAGGHVAYLDPGAAALTPTQLASGDVALYGSPSGDVWAATNGHLTRYALGVASADAPWQAEVAPVFARACARCHLPGGSSGVDLSTPGAWHDEHDEIRRRAVETKTMPPTGAPPLSDHDRAALASWLDGK